MGIRKLFIILILFFQVDLFSKETFKIKDSLRECAEDSLCSAFESVVFFPISPWVLYLNDDKAHKAQNRRFESFNYEFDAEMTKLNNNFSGYNVNINLLYKNIGLKVSYDTFFDGLIDNRHYRLNIILRPRPMRHFQPSFSFGWRYIETDTYFKNGPEISFFNYKVMFSRRYHLILANYLFLIDSKVSYENIIMNEYYLYPTISLKLGINIKYVIEELYYGVQTGVSLKLI